MERHPEGCYSDTENPVRGKPRFGCNVVEGYKASVEGNGLRVLNEFPAIIQRGAALLTPSEKELLKWVGIFFRKPTPGKFMMRVRMPNGFGNSRQLRALADVSHRLGNGVMDITTRQQVELRGFTLESVPEIWEKLRGVDLHSLQTGIDNVRNINGCPLAGLTPNELLDASSVLFDLDRMMVGRHGNPEYANLPRKFNITVTGCLENCTHNESQDIALVAATRNRRKGFNILVGGKMGSGGFTVASSLDVFVQPSQAVAAVLELVKIYRDQGPRETRSKCRFAFLVEQWGISRLRGELTARLGHRLEPQGADMRKSGHADHLGVTPQKQPGLFSVGVCVLTGRVNPHQLAELARLAEFYGNGQVRFTTGQNAIVPSVASDRVKALLAEPLLQQMSPSPSPFFRGLVACTGTDYCNMALIETKSRAVELSSALEHRMGTKVSPVTIHWSGCPAGCGNHQAADIGLRGFKTKIDGQIVDAVAVYVGGRTGQNAVAGKEIMEMVPCSDGLPDVIAAIIQDHVLQAQGPQRLADAPELTEGRPLAMVAAHQAARESSPASAATGD